MRRHASELSDTAIATIVEDALREQELINQMTAALRSGDNQRVRELVRRLTGIEDTPLPPAA
jgi:hypothetical protein